MGITENIDGNKIVITGRVFTISNIISFSRVLIAFPIMYIHYKNGFTFNIEVIFLIVYAVISDYLDGLVARKTNSISEETGLQCEQLYYVGHFYPAIGYSDEVIHVYAGIGLTQVDNNTDTDEFLVNNRIPYREALQMISTGEINDGKTIICLYKVWNWLNLDYALE